MKLSLSCRALLWSAPGRDFLSDRGVVDATTLARLVLSLSLIPSPHLTSSSSLSFLQLIKINYDPHPNLLLV